MEVIQLIFTALAIICLAFAIVMIAPISLVLHIMHIASEDEKTRFSEQNKPISTKNT